MTIETATDEYNRKRRSSISITLSVWNALFLREAVSRLSTSRAAWAGLLLGPVIHITFMVVMFTFVRMRTMSGIDIAVWLIVGVLFYNLFKNTSQQVKNGLGANQALFTYRQVKPIDALLVRAAMEASLSIVIIIIISFGATLFGIDLFPDDPLAVLIAFFGMWLMGLGWGLLCSVIFKLTPELGKVVDIITGPMYLLSGVILPIAHMPPFIREWLVYIPMAHGLEAARLGASSYYHAFPELDIAYLYEFALTTIFLGLGLHKRFARKLVTK